MGLSIRGIADLLPSASMLESERRRAPRVVDCFAMRALASERPARVGVVRNWSRTGLLFASMSRFSVGELVSIVVLDGEKSGITSVHGRVVRAERDSADNALFPWLVAMELDPQVDVRA